MSINPQTTLPNQSKGGVQSPQKLFLNGAEHRSRSKGGRPPKAENEQLNNFVKVYFDDETYNKICSVAKRSKKSRSTICREYILDGYTISPVTKEQTSYIRKLAGMATNLNQLAHESHIQFTEDLANRVKALADKIDDVLIWFSNKITHG